MNWSRVGILGPKEPPEFDDAQEKCDYCANWYYLGEIHDLGDVVVCEDCKQAALRDLEEFYGPDSKAG